MQIYHVPVTRSKTHARFIV